MIYALNVSDWVVMDIKCKKLLLMAMKMNNANQKKLRFSQLKIINLEFFFSVSIPTTISGSIIKY